MKKYDVAIATCTYDTTPYAPVYSALLASGNLLHRP